MSFTVTELKKMAKKLNIPKYYKMNKDELCDILNIDSSNRTFSDEKTIENLEYKIKKLENKIRDLENDLFISNPEKDDSGYSFGREYIGQNVQKLTITYIHDENDAYDGKKYLSFHDFFNLVQTDYFLRSFLQTMKESMIIRRSKDIYRYINYYIELKPFHKDNMKNEKFELVIIDATIDYDGAEVNTKPLEKYIGQFIDINPIDFGNHTIEFTQKNTKVIIPLPLDDIELSTYLNMTTFFNNAPLEQIKSLFSTLEKNIRKKSNHTVHIHTKKSNVNWLQVMIENWDKNSTSEFYSFV